MTGSRSLGGQRGSAATTLYFRSLPPHDQFEKRLQIFYAEAVARARKKGEPPPRILIEYVPRPIPHPAGRPAKRNRYRDRKRAEREATAKEAAEAVTKLKTEQVD
jgi:hypothetical protein